MEDMCQLSERLTDDKYRGSYEQVSRVIARHSARFGINGKKRRLRRSGFVAFGESAGIHGEATVGLIDTVLRETEAMTVQIEQSPLEQAARERVAHIVRERAERLRA